MKPKNIITLLVVTSLFVMSGCASQQSAAEEKAPEKAPSEKQETSVPPKAEERTVALYYYNPEKDKDSDDNLLCSANGLVKVVRTIPETNTPIEDTIRLLLKGNITSQEKAEGVTSEYPLPGVELTGASLKNGKLTLSLNDPQGKTSGGSCRAGILWAQIKGTAMQFPEVTSVGLSTEFLFQP